ncbi:unnamed protein product [Oikopleura dioica]|uniref:Netrin receptor UNC5 n=1 Tax=Oikopleura dioica TaxID=34765 RepID=E4XS03_OIKDI|nr:unnamed protein product [Oikopleura dioica]
MTNFYVSKSKPFPTKPYFSVGENIQLHCVPPKGLPAPRITWIKNGKILDPNRDKNLIINYDNDLIVKAARYSDSGNYVCLAENIVGSRESPAAKIEVKTDGIWSRWSDWSKCPLNSCAKIRAFRTRACDAPAPHNGGKECDGEKREERDCANECPIDGGWSNWSKWSECSAKCVQKHERSCIRPKPENGGDECSGIGIEEIPCQGGNCQETLFSSLVDQPALAVGLAVVTVMFLTAIGIGICVIQRMRANNTKRSMRMERCQTSRCSDLYDRYIPGYMAPSTSSSSESRDNRQPQIMSTQLSNNVGDNQIEKFITAAHGGEMNFAGVNLSIPPDAVNKDQMISLRVCGSDGPLLPQHQVLLSPVVIVGPPSLKIKKTLKLSIPHCVHPGNEIYSSETRRISAGDYYGWNLEVKPIGAALKVERIKSAYQSVATLALKETGSWSIVGTPKISPNSRSFASHKAVYVLVYGRDVDLSGNEVQIRIRVSDQLPATYDMIDRDERENRSKPLCPAEVFCVAKMNSGLKVRLEPANLEWTTTMMTQCQEVPESQLWRRYARPVVFNLRRVGNSPNPFLNLNINVQQGNNPAKYIKAAYPLPQP